MQETTEITTRLNTASLEALLVQGDLSKLTTKERLEYYLAVCESLGLNPTTTPFSYIRLNNKLTLYALKACTDQLRRIYGVSVTSCVASLVEDIYCVVATGTDKTGRTDTEMGAVAMGKLQGEAKANAMMKAQTKSKRRLTLSLCGLGMLDETEVETIPHAVTTDVDVAHGMVKQPDLPSVRKPMPVIEQTPPESRQTRVEDFVETGPVQAEETWHDHVETPEDVGGLDKWLQRDAYDTNTYVRNVMVKEVHTGTLFIVTMDEPCGDEDGVIPGKRRTFELTTFKVNIGQAAIKFQQDVTCVAFVSEVVGKHTNLMSIIAAPHVESEAPKAKVHQPLTDDDIPF